MATAVEEVNKAIQSVFITLPRIEQLKSEYDKCLRHFIVGKDLMELFSIHTIFSKFHNVAVTLCTS